MEFSLNNKVFEYMGAVYKNSFTREETTESIIPDSLPDAQRVIETEAMVCLRSKEAENGRVVIAGTADVSVIYADEEGRIRRTVIGIPFNASEENGNVVGGAKVTATVRAASADARLLNPRKLLVRCDVLIDVACYVQKEIQLKLPAENADTSLSVQILTDERDMRLLTDVSEKTFVIREEYALPASKAPVGEVLRTKLTTELEDVKSVGNKVILKGTARLSLLYRPEKGGEPVNAEFSTVFSQIMEIGVKSEDLHFKASLVPTSIYFVTDALYSPDDRRIAVEAHFLAQCLAYRDEAAAWITDVYSGKYELKTGTAGFKLNSAGDALENVELVRGVVETAGQPGNVVSISVLPGVVYKNHEGERLELKTTVCVNVLYISEDGVLLSASKKMPVSTAIPWENDAEYSVSAEVRSEPLAVISTDGIEVKFSVAFRVECGKLLSIDAVDRIDADTENPKDLSVLPSIVVKRFVNGDTLWSMAKKYSSARELICCANGIEEGTEPEPNSVLIIPRIR